MNANINDLINPISTINKIEKAISNLLKKWPILLAAAVVGGALGYIYAKKQKITYQSHLTFSLEEDNNGSMSHFASIAAQFGISGGDENVGMFSGDNIIEVLKTRRMVEGVLLSVDTFEDNKASSFIDYYLSMKPGKNPVYFGVNPNKQTLTHEQDSILYKTYLDMSEQAIRVTRPQQNLNIFELSIVSPSEKFTKLFTDRLLAQTTKFYTELRTKKSQETVDILEQRVESLKSNLNNSISDKAIDQDANLNPAFSSPMVPVQKQEFNLQVYGKAYEELYKDLEVARYQCLQNTPLLQVIDEADYPMERVKASTFVYIFIGSMVFIFLTGIILLVILKMQKAISS